jgi:hypothetical protein
MSGPLFVVLRRLSADLCSAETRLRRCSGGYRCRVARVVVVSSSQIEREALSEVISADDELHVVVPAVEQSRLQWLANDDDAARDEGLAVGKSIGRAAPAEPSSVDVKPDAPSQVVLDAIAEHAPDRIVVALRDGEEASWLEDGELEEFPREIDGIPVVRISI